MIPLTVGNILVWGIIGYTRRNDKRRTFIAHQDSLPDYDLEYLAKLGVDNDNVPDYFDLGSHAIIEELSYQYNGAMDEEIPVDVYLWANGYRFVIGDPDDVKRWLEMKNRAYLQQEYNSKPFPDGEMDMYIDWFRMKGYSAYQAERLAATGEKPWEYSDLIY